MRWDWKWLISAERLIAIWYDMMLQVILCLIWVVQWLKSHEMEGNQMLFDLLCLTKWLSVRCWCLLQTIKYGPRHIDDFSFIPIVYKAFPSLITLNSHINCKSWRPRVKLISIDSNSNIILFFIFHVNIGINLH